MKISNKTVQYRLKADDEHNVMRQIDDSADVTLPSIEKMTDTVSGAGIMGEIDWPTYGQISSSTVTINVRSDNPHYSILARPGVIRLEIVWVVDQFDTSGLRIGLQQHKVFIAGVNKTYNPGTIGVNAAADGSLEFEWLTYRKVVDGREVMLVDKLNYKFVVNGIDYMQQLRTALQ